MSISVTQLRTELYLSHRGSIFDGWCCVNLPHLEVEFLGRVGVLNTANFHTACIPDFCPHIQNTGNFLADNISSVRPKMNICKMRKHPSRMHIACSLTIPHSIQLGGLPKPQMQTPLDVDPQADIPWMQTPPGCRLPGCRPPEGMTHACENITFPQLLLRAVKMSGIQGMKYAKVLFRV